ncbi:type-F conjugative transfer system mating-pair stabilization protein TraN [Legionella bozemanae]|uniref:Protein TraN n=1 Tax=Legionella bozemanae TaxID=447 RepID=A0A0W0RQ30_LEGBO|nr:type-F conjugative transfer system mating-pair stabilization protein TraN [Legionella bozemanae]KTC73157.1 protein TraN [Legionella bozemanae]STP14100.1 conjugal transfer mating pair stabilization protein TraN [Legionella bozemanae]
MKHFIFIFLILSSQINALDLKQAYQEGAQTGKNHANQSIDLLKALDLNQFPGYQANLSQEHYYSGVTQENTGLETDSQKGVMDNESGKAVHEGFNHRPLQQVNPASNTMQKLNQIAENGDAIIRGQNTDKTTCSLKPKECHYSWQEKTCLTSKGLGALHCARNLRLEVSAYKTESYTLYLRKNGKRTKPFQVLVNLTQGDTCQQGKNPCYTIYKDQVTVPAIKLPEHCALVKVNIVDAKGLVVVQQTANCAQPSLTVSVGKCRYGRCTIPYFHSATMTVEIYERKEYWDDQCKHLNNKEQEELCHITEPLTCTEPNQTRIIGEIPFTRPCWKERATYKCGDEGQNTCGGMINEGCEQTASICLKEDGGRCKTYQQTYQCPLNQCTENQLLCGDSAFCLEGDCATHEYIPANENDFKKAMSTLSSVSDASKDFDVNANYIFKGKLLECSTTMLHFKNCCSDSGWGIDLELAHCSDSEKKLGKARENKLVVPTGHYCYKRRKFPGGSVCTDTHETYCVFQSKLARIVQEQGRRNQLHISFGKGKHSNCSGITPEQMQLIHFEAINFSEFYDDVKNKMKKPDYGQTANGISQRLKEIYNQGDING